MKILAINYQNPTLRIQNVKTNKLNALSVLKHDTVCFKSRDLLSMQKEEIFKKVEESITPSNFLGQGTEAEVYKIKDTNYCVRIPYFAQDCYNANFSKELTPIDKINHIVAKLGFGASIMKYFDGIIPKWYKNNNDRRYDLQNKISDMPVKSYSELLKQIAEAIDNEMLFDFSGGNLIVDTKNKKLTAIDFYGISDNPKPIKPLSEMYSVLTCYGSTENIGKKIFNKIIDAGLKEFEPNKIPCMDVALFDFADLCTTRKRDKYLPYAEKIISQIMYHTDLLQKLKRKEIIDKSVSFILEKKISEVRKLLNQVK